MGDVKVRLPLIAAKMAERNCWVNDVTLFANNAPGGVVSPYCDLARLLNFEDPQIELPRPTIKLLTGIVLCLDSIGISRSGVGLPKYCPSLMIKLKLP